MTANVRLFAVARQLVGQANLVLELPDGSHVADLRALLAREYPALAGLLPKILVAVNSEYADESMLLTSSSEIALIPPVSGGFDG